MRPTLLLATAIAVSLLVAGAHGTCANVKPLKASLYTEIVQKIYDTIINATTVATFPSSATLVRLAFHDCLGTGGCDGCVNLAIRENFGIEPVVLLLEGFYTGTIMNLTTCQISRADLWALAGFVASSTAALRKANVTLPASLSLDPTTTPFKWGRKDCPTSPFNDEAHELFPGGHLNGNDTVHTLTSRFGVTEEQAVALMGAHNLGKASRKNSGYSGCNTPNPLLTSPDSPIPMCPLQDLSPGGAKWVPGNDILDNTYFVGLTIPVWFQVALPEDDTVVPGPLPSLQSWILNKQPNPVFPGFLINLNSDVGLAHEIQSGINPGLISSYPPSAFQPYVFAYAADNDLFLSKYGEAFIQMLSRAGADFEYVAYTDLKSVVLPKPPSPPRKLSPPPKAKSG